MNSIAIGVSASVGALLLAGLAVGGYVLYQHHQHPAAAAPKTYTTMPVGSSIPVTSASGAVVTAIPVSGSDLAQQTAASAAAAKLAAEQAAREAEWRRTDKIQSLQRELDSVWNQIKVNDTQITAIESRPPPPGMYQQVKDELYHACMATKGWFFAGARCDSEVPESRIQSELKSRWDAQLKSESTPYRASQSELDSRQKQLISNLADLGSRVQPVMVRGSA